MKRRIKTVLEKSSRIKKIFDLINFLRGSKLIKVTGLNKKFPKVLQLPITTKCNSKCVMCNIPNMCSKNELSLDEFNDALSDSIFKKVHSVGINGGEPTLLSDLAERAKCIIDQLPSLKQLNIISNGFLTDRLLSATEEIYSYCKSHDVSFHIAISLDGLEHHHDVVRGIPNAFSRTIKTINAIKSSNKYCDSYDVGCTVVAQNVDYLIEFDEFAKLNDIKIKYRLGISNKRIESDRKFESYSVFTTESFKQSAIEFFYSRYKYATSISEKFKYFSIFRFLSEPESKRLLGCMWQEEGITLDPKGNIYYCAVESEPIGSLREDNGELRFFNSENIKYRNSIVKNKCDTCIHDYNGKNSLANVINFIKTLLYERYKFRKFKRVV